jgi:hypothetical protein
VQRRSAAINVIVAGAAGRELELAEAEAQAGENRKQLLGVGGHWIDCNSLPELVSERSGNPHVRSPLNAGKLHRMSRNSLSRFAARLWLNLRQMVSFKRMCFDPTIAHAQVICRPVRVTISDTQVIIPCYLYPYYCDYGVGFRLNILGSVNFQE